MLFGDNNSLSLGDRMPSVPNNLISFIGDLVARKKPTHNWDVLYIITVVALMESFL